MAGMTEGVLESISVALYRAARLGVWPNASEDEFCLLLMFLKSLLCLMTPCKRGFVQPMCAMLGVTVSVD
jgi:hypothetical protein